MKARPFADSTAHLLAELEFIDLLIRSRVAHLRRVQTEDENFRGLYISEAEIDASLARPIGAPQWLKAAEGGRLEATDAALQAMARDLAARRAASAQAGVPLRFDRLQSAFGLDAFDQAVLLVCLAVEIDVRFEKLFAYLQDDVTRKRPSVDLVLHLLEGQVRDPLEGRRHFLPTSPLLARRLVELRDDPSQPDSPLLARVVRPHDRIVQFLLGSDDLDAALRDAALVVPPGRTLDDLLMEDAGRAELRQAVATESPGRPMPVLLLQGPVGGGRCSVAGALAGERGRPLIVVDVAAWAERDDGAAVAQGAASRWADMAALVQREAGLRDACVHWRHLGALAGETHRGARAVLMRAIDAMDAPCSLAQDGSSDDVDATAAFPRRGAVRAVLPMPGHAHRTAAWQAALAGLPVDADVDAPSLANRFKLSVGRIEDAAAFAARLARVRDGDAAHIGTRDLQDACRVHSNQRLAALARKTSPHHRWEDIVLPADRMALLREICNHVKYRERVYGQWGFGRKLALGKGLAVLFAGPSGTGKTMAAGVIASELSLDLYKIDLSTVISKYIGETEKNLGRIFDEAESSNAILFFDEADALFGKRSEVRDSHDRYANIEVGYLLQRMEQYEGVAILATNFRKNMDDAFVRRLHFTLEFPYPNDEDRHRIWQGIWPADTPRDESLDLRLLARRYEMTGGSIKNVALAAAFLAADDGQRVRMDHVRRATLREYQKTGKLMSDNEESDFESLAGQRR